MDAIENAGAVCRNRVVVSVAVLVELVVERDERVDVDVVADDAELDAADEKRALARYEALVSPIARRYKNSAVTAHRAFLGSSSVKARLRDVILRIAPDRLLERSVRRVFDAERPLTDLPVSHPG